MREIFGIGIDMIQICRVEGACKRASFLEKYFSGREREIIDKRLGRAATNFAGKEAVVKAFGTGFSHGIIPQEIEILRKETGAPYVELTGRALQWAESHKISRIHISLTDTKEYASAYVVAEQECAKTTE